MNQGTRQGPRQVPRTFTGFQGQRGQQGLNRGQAAAQNLNLPNVSRNDIARVINNSWTSAIAAVAGEPPCYLSATEAAVILSPYWQMGKSMGLYYEDLFDYAVRHVQAEMPYCQRENIQVPPGFDYRRSPRAFNYNPMYRPGQAFGNN